MLLAQAAIVPVHLPGVPRGPHLFIHAPEAAQPTRGPPRRVRFPVPGASSSTHVAQASGWRTCHPPILRTREVFADVGPPGPAPRCSLTDASGRHASQVWLHSVSGGLEQETSLLFFQNHESSCKGIFLRHVVFCCFISCLLQNLHLDIKSSVTK